MSSGTVTYKSDMMYPHREIYAGTAAQEWPMKQISGAFPKDGSYKIVSARIKIDIRNVYDSTRHMLVSRQSGEELGDVPTTKAGEQELPLNTDAYYENITRIKTDGVEKWACQLRGGSYIYIIVQWESTVPENIEPKKAPDPVVITGVEKEKKKGAALHTTVAVSFENVDISDPINENLLSLSYTDNEEDEADDLQIKLEDHNYKWLDKWLNDTMLQAAYGIKKGSKGIQIAAGVKQFRPDGKTYKSSFGFFELDSIRASGPPGNILIKGTSLPFSNGIRTEERNKSWENYTLSSIGKEIAERGGLGFLYDCPRDPKYTRVEQAKQTDISFFMQLCHDNGYSLKISGLKMIVFDQSRYENMDPITTIRRMDGTYTKYDLSTSEGDVHYDQCQVVYYDSKTDKKYEGVANAEDYDPEKEEHTVCVISDRKVSSDKEAKELASKILRMHNKYEKQVSFTLIGNPLLGAGMTMAIEDFGLWDEKYIIKTCKHDIGSSGYTTQVKLRKIPEGKVSIVKKSEEEEGTENSKGKNDPTEMEWRTKYNVTVYATSDGNQVTGFIVAGQPVRILGALRDGRHYIGGPGKQRGYVAAGSLEYVDKSKPHGKGILG